MNHEHSAGIVVYFQRHKKREYLLLHYAAGHWDFPKGHLEPGETNHQAALRELREETGINTIKLVDDYQESISYLFTKSSTHQLVKKTVDFFIGQSRTKQVTLSFEHQGFLWLPYKEAHELLTYDNAKELLRKIEIALNKRIAEKK